jgi:hypothetical protein
MECKDRCLSKQASWYTIFEFTNTIYGYSRKYIIFMKIGATVFVRLTIQRRVVRNIPAALTTSKRTLYVWVFNDSGLKWGYILNQYYSFDLRSGEELCCLCGTDWILEYYLDVV